MDAQDKITEKLKEAARKIESASGFSSMERVWDKIEERLDEEQEQKKVIPFWRKGMAAAILMVIGLSAFYLLRREDHKPDTMKSLVQTKQQLPPGKQEQRIEKVIAQTPVNKIKAVRAKGTSKKLTTIEALPLDTEPSAITSGTDPTNQIAPATDDITRIVKGIVVDNMMQPMPGASVVVKGTTQGTTTDMDGNYTIEMKGSERALVIKSMGVEDQEVAVTSSSSPLITKMAERKDRGLKEIEVYGKAIDKRSYTGALTTVTAKDIARRPVKDIVKVIEGTAPGVQVSSGGGQPGATPDILMRGVGSVAANNAPLIVLDGDPYNRTLASIDPKNVDTMIFLKDASATGLYGSRGANGVIVITGKNTGSKHSGSFFHKTFRKMGKLFTKNKKQKVNAVTPEVKTSGKSNSGENIPEQR